MRDALDVRVERVPSDQPPEHHITPTTASPVVWTSYLPSTPRIWGIGGSKQEDDEKKEDSVMPKDGIAGFQNPWPSFHKATKQEFWRALEWGQDADTAIQLAASHLDLPSDSHAISSKKKSQSTQVQTDQLLQTEKPDFSFVPNERARAKTTWLGHAGMLLQLPPIKPDDGNPIRIIFDPIFSHRSSPSQNIGPVRSYTPPCRIEDLPTPIHALVISHNHFDHLDYDTVRSLWRLNMPSMRIIVPLGNSRWFISSCGIPEENVTELDWWESAYLSEEAGGHLKFTCTPAQHSSLRDGRDADLALWASWFITHKPPSPPLLSDQEEEDDKSYRVFFAGDSGYQFHGDPSWPPKPPPGTTHEKLSRGDTQRVADPDQNGEQYPPCPAFKDIATRLGTPDLVYLPVALGATWAYLRSFFSNYVPSSAVPVPRHSMGVTGAIHLAPWDAVRALRDVTSTPNPKGKRPPPVAVAMHWGTFVTEPVEILKTLGQLEWACYNQSVTFGRSLENQGGEPNEAGEPGKRQQPLFLALNHGQSIFT